jgi:ATP-binding cassette subfamily F protein uup
VFDQDDDGKGIVKEYVGGYQEYLVQKNREEAARAAKAPANNATSNKTAHKSTTAKPAKAAKKLNYNEQRELDNLPKEIAALETEQKQLEEKLADGSWFNKDVDAATAASARLLAIEEEMMSKLERWSTLEG